MKMPYAQIAPKIIAGLLKAETGDCCAILFVIRVFSHMMGENGKIYNRTEPRKPLAA